MGKTRIENVAVLFFSRSPETEARYKRFVGGRRSGQNHAVAKALIRHTRKQIKRSGLPVFEFDEHHQQGQSFGQRLSNAFLTVFRNGYDHVIAVGNDTPALRTSHIRNAARELAERGTSIVLGPASDGGTWLMGYRREAFEPTSFLELPWNSPDLLDTILETREREVTVALLPVLGDIDDERGLYSFLNQFSCNRLLVHLIRYIQSILKQEQAAFLGQQSPISTGVRLFPFLLRAPPACCSSP